MALLDAITLKPFKVQFGGHGACTVQTFIQNSNLLTGLEFKCKVRIFFVRGTGSSQTSVIRNCIQKFVLAINTQSKVSEFP